MLKKISILISRIAGIFSTSAQAVEYSVGQVWTYKTRPGEERSRLIIVKITKQQSDQVAYSIYLENIKLKNPHIKGGMQDHLPHAPVTKDVLDRSVVKIEETRKDLPDFEYAYKEWKTAFDSDDGGIFSITVAEIVTTIEKAANAKLE